MGKLTSLRILTKFFVSKEVGFCLQELGPLKLKGDLDIEHLGKVKSVMDAKEANMSIKQLNTLWLSWDRNEESELHENVEEILEVLHLDVQQLLRLEVEEYLYEESYEGEVVFRALEELTLRYECLEKLWLSNCREVESLQALQDMTSLQELKLKHLPKLESLPDCFGCLPSLHTLILQSYNMAEFVLETLLGNLKSLVQKELLLFLGFDQDLERLSSLFTAIKATLEDAEEKQFSNRAIKDWLEKLKHEAHILDDIIDECAYEVFGLENQGVKCGPSNKILKLDRCRRLKMLPNSLICLKALQQLSFNGCQELSRLPPQIGKLTSLRILTKFFVGKERGFCLEELGSQKLKGDLDIKHLGNVKSVMDAKEANMSRLPLLGKLPSLKTIRIQNMIHVEYFYQESYDGEVVFRALEDLSLRQLPNLKMLSRQYGENMFPRFSILEIDGCPKFLGEEVLLHRLHSLSALQYMTSLKEIRLRNLHELESLPDCFGNLSLLHTLSIFHCSKLTCLPMSLSLSVFSDCRAQIR
ncbi:Putative disease resistance protein RGA3 [Glycine soja]|nr:Putative disease resistance protein RGA3 [Glycine soja]